MCTPILPALPRAPGFASGANDTQIGGYTGSSSENRSVQGLIANVQIFNRALLSSEITQIKAVPGSVTSGQVGFWPLMGGATEADRSGANAGTLVGSTISSLSPSTAILTAGYNAPLTSLTTTGNAITINGVTTTGGQSYTGAGAVTLNGPLTTTSNGNINASGAASLTVSQAISANGGGTVTLAASGGSSDITTSAAIASGSGLITLLADNHITLNIGGTVGASTTGAITISADNDASGAGILTTTIAIGNASAAGAITLSGADIDLGAAVMGSGILTIQPSTQGRTIGLGGGAGLFALSVTELGYLSDGFSSITIGRADGNGALIANAVSFTDPVILRSPGGAITVNAITATDNASVTLSSAATTINGSISTSDNPITIAASSGGITMFAGALSSGTGDITLTGTGAIAGSYGIHLAAGGPTITTTSGNISLTAVGTVTAPGMRIANVGTIISTATGTITLTGTGGPSAAGVSTHGVHLDAGAIVRSTSNSTITITGTAGTGDWSGFGIRNQGSTVSAVNGAINLIGYGKGSDYR